ncbi:MAG TPA: DUF1566 domain-containing protein [bacterium]|nr:DUF1566 domain-containing protein [bacterium]
MRIFLILLVLLLSFSVFAEESKEKDRLAVMDLTDGDLLFNQKTKEKITAYVFDKFQETGIYWMIPKSDRDTALEQAIEETKQGSRKECVDEKCQLSLVAGLQANFLINTEIKQLVKGKCQISIRKFDVEKRAGTAAWLSKFDCTEGGVYEAVESLNFDGTKSDSKTVEAPEIRGMEDKKKPDLQEKKVAVIDAKLKPSDRRWSKKAQKEMTWNDALKYCEDLEEDGFSDWRLPTISELRTLIQKYSATATGGACRVTDECLSSEKCKGHECTGYFTHHDGRYSKLGDVGSFWSSSQLSDKANNVWVVGFSNGYLSSGSIKDWNTKNFRCVR